MTPPRQEWDPESLDEKFAEVDAKLAELDRRQGRMQRALRNRPTKRQLNERFAEVSGSATRGQIWVAAIGAAALVIAALITGLVDIFNTPPQLPTK